MRPAEDARSSTVREKHPRRREGGGKKAGVLGPGRSGQGGDTPSGQGGDTLNGQGTDHAAKPRAVKKAAKGKRQKTRQKQGVRGRVRAVKSQAK